jgi:zinc transport system ATP-binding protein
MPKPSLTQNNAVSVNNLSVSIAGKVILDKMSFTIEEGSIAAIIGPNGSGKSTLLKALLGILPSEGDIQFFGKSISHIRKRIGYVPQSFRFDTQFPLTVAEFLSLITFDGITEKDIIRALKDTGLPRKIMGERLGTLSGGQLQRVLIAQAILHDPDLLVLDEPSTGIDIVGEEAFLQILLHLREHHHTTIILVSHDIGMVSNLVDTVICVNKKLLCYGPPKSTLTEKHLKELYGDHASAFSHKHV